MLKNLDFARPAFLNRIGSIFYLWMKAGADCCPRSYEEIKTGSSERYDQLFSELLKRGVYLAPSGFEVGFISQAHTIDELDKTVKIMDEAMSCLPAVTHEAGVGRGLSTCATADSCQVCC